jgi:L-fucose isomerase-like protein
METSDLWVIFEIAIIFGIGYHIGKFVATIEMLEVFKILTGKEINEEYINDAIEKLEETHTDIFTKNKIQFFETETINDILYLYTKGKEQFVCQAKTLEDLCKMCFDNNKINAMLLKHNNESYYYNGSILEKVTDES